jgi:hypothetical protein
MFEHGKAHSNKAQGANVFLVSVAVLLAKMRFSNHISDGLSN